MAEFSDHIQQSLKNLGFLQQINERINDCYDWQVTVSFYVALHIVNAHLSHADLQYRKHVDVKNILNPHNKLSTLRLPDDEYVSYMSLQSLSRRSRYLVNEQKLNDNLPAFTNEKHLIKAIKNLDTIIKFFSEKYKLDIPNIKIKCVHRINTTELKMQHFEFISN